VLAGGHRALGQRRVQMVRGADVHDVHVAGVHQLLGGGGGALRQQPAGRARLQADTAGVSDPFPIDAYAGQGPPRSCVTSSSTGQRPAGLLDLILNQAVKLVLRPGVGGHAHA
jgi:hypothetical protein